MLQRARGKIGQNLVNKSQLSTCLTRYAFLVCLLLCADFSNVYAQNKDLHGAQDSSGLKLTVVTEHWPPFSYLNEEGEVDGIATDIVREVMSRLEYDYHIEVLSWERAYQKAKNEANVLLYTIYELENRIDDFQWICPFLRTGGSEVYALSASAINEIKDIQELKQYRVGVFASGWSYEYLHAFGFEVGEHLDIVRDELANIRKLFAGRVDVIVQEPDIIGVRLQKVGQEAQDVKSIFKLGAHVSQSGCMAMSRDTDPNIIASIKKTLATVIK